jgi:RNA polymerase sigma-70 factor (ECF subfamily)
MSNLKEQEDAFTQAHNEFHKALHSYASYKVSSASLSEDLVQDTFIKTWSYLVKGGEITKMKAFLYHVLNGLIIDEYRKKKATSLDVLLEKGFELSDTSSERTIDYFDGKKAILLIDSLPEAYQKVMQMRYVEDLSLEEMAVITGKTKNTMAVHAHRGMEKLRELYIEQQGQK